MIAGFALAPLTAGTSLAFLGASPMAAAMTVGGITGLAKGSLKEGLMAGLGAYGGAGMQAGLAASAAGTGLSSSGAPLNSVMGASAAPAATTAATTATPALGGSMMAGAPQSTLGSGFYSSAPNITAPMTSALKVPTLTATGTMAQPTLWNQTVAGSKAAFGGGTEGMKALYGNLPGGTLPALGLTLAQAAQKDFKPPQADKGMIRPYEFSRTQNPEAYNQGNPIYAQDPGSSRERNYFNDQYTALPTYAAADGGLATLNAFATGGPIEQMSAQNAIGANQMYPQAHLQTAAYTNPMNQLPTPNNVITGSMDAPVDPYTGEARFADGGATGSYNLGGYSDGGRLLKGPGDGVSDSIPAVIGDRQPARLADGEFVVPARIVSELGNGSTEAGAKRLYAMMDRVQHARRKSIGKGKVAVNSKTDKFLPA
tara:strand:- start:655 stop:1935 length:1281 start_codon:yes stop_codon:yes gene_type:complete